MPSRTLFTSAPTRSQTFAISFINEIFAASMAFAAYFVISALAISIKIIFSLFFTLIFQITPIFDGLFENFIIHYTNYYYQKLPLL